MTSFPISLQKLSAQLLDKIPKPYSSNDICPESMRRKSVCRSSPNLADLKYDAKLSSCRSNPHGCFTNSSFTKDQCPRGRLAIKMAGFKSSDDLAGQHEYPSPPLSTSSKADSYHDYTHIKGTYTSNVRFKLARNEPISSHYHNEHMELYGKPPFVWGVRKSSDEGNGFQPRRSIRKYEMIY